MLLLPEAKAGKHEGLWGAAVLKERFGAACQLQAGMATWQSTD